MFVQGLNFKINWHFPQLAPFPLLALPQGGIFRNFFLPSRIRVQKLVKTEKRVLKRGHRGHLSPKIAE